MDDLREGAERALFDEACLRKLHAPRLDVVRGLLMEPEADERVPLGEGGQSYFPRSAMPMPLMIAEAKAVTRPG